MHIHLKPQEIHLTPTSLNQERSGLDSPESEDHQPPQPQPQLQLQQQVQEQVQVQEQEQEQLQKRPNEGNSEEPRISVDSHECNKGGKDDEENMEIKGDHTSNNNGGVMGPRERLKRHRREVAGQVWIPDMWGQEDFLKDWIDCSAFDASLVPQGIMLARASLMKEGRRSNSNTLRLENSC